MIPDPQYFHVYVPEGASTRKYLNSTVVPFGTFWSGCRYQQVYDASLFTNRIPVGGGFVWHMYFRAGCGGRQGTGLTNTVIRMSTTSREVDELSSDFDQNLGEDVLVVSNPKVGVFRGSHPSCRINPPPPEGIWNPFVEFGFDTAFFYNPAKGNLLLELLVSSHDASDGLDPSVFKVLGEATPEDDGRVASLAAGSTNATVAEVQQNFGLVTHFLLADFPRIDITPAENSVILSWPANPGPTELQERDSLDASVSWRPYSGAQKPFRGQFTTSVELPESTLRARRYYRLFWNSPQIGLPDTTIEVNPSSLP